MSQAIQRVLDAFNEFNIDKEAESLSRFYANVMKRAEGITTAAGRQKLLTELYDNFFRKAFPKMSDRLGIVYTPVEVVDFIIHSVNDILQAEFGQSLGSEGVNILDPFTGTGTFIVRLLQSGLIKVSDLPRVYSKQLQANEIVLLAYYMAAINIESTYHAIVEAEYRPFPGILLSDTFNMHVGKNTQRDSLLEHNSQRRKEQIGLDISVIIGNPPYSVGQKSENDNNKNLKYPELDKRLTETYVRYSKAGLKRNLYDSYIRAFRWASDRIGDRGIIGFVTNGSYIESLSSDGFRKGLSEEFSNIYIFHLRGNSRTLREQQKKEGGNIFGQASRAPIAIAILVKNPAAKQNGQIFFYDIGDYLTTEEKLKALASISSIKKLENKWLSLTPDAHNDWFNKRDDSFSQYILMAKPKKQKDKELAIFENYSLGITTSRDAWCINSSKKSLTENMSNMIAHYNSELSNYHMAKNYNGKVIKETELNAKLSMNPSLISWSYNLKKALQSGKALQFASTAICVSTYRPFNKQWLYFNRDFNERVCQMPKIFPISGEENIIIGLSGQGAKSFSCLITDKVTNLHTIEQGQWFPLYLYIENSSNDFFEPPLKRCDAISDAGLQHFRKAYHSEAISKEDLFYYIYGLLHSEDYRSRFADNLLKEMPRIPAVKTLADFIVFSKAGRALAALHLNYETVDKYPATIVIKNKTLAELKATDYYVKKMKHGRIGKDKDRSRIIYNEKITVTSIPLEAYNYKVNGKSAIELVMDRQSLRADKDSGIINDANAWAVETMDNPAYPLELLLRIITVALETIKIVRALPKLDI